MQTIRSSEPVNALRATAPGVSHLLSFLLVGTVFGLVLTKGEVISWFRIQEMFRFQSPRMYLIIASAVIVAGLSIEALKRSQAHALNGERIALAPKQLGRGYGYVLGGTMFGIGWAFTGACPGPLFALLGSGVSVFTVTIASAVLGTWLYGHVRPWLPH
jgi:uncharacterized membrane protein YedE/YeeE